MILFDHFVCLLLISSIHTHNLPDQKYGMMLLCTYVMKSTFLIVFAGDRWPEMIQPKQIKGFSTLPDQARENPEFHFLSTISTFLYHIPHMHLLII